MALVEGSISRRGRATRTTSRLALPATVSKGAFALYCVCHRHVISAQLGAGLAPSDFFGTDSYFFGTGGPYTRAGPQSFPTIFTRPHLVRRGPEPPRRLRANRPTEAYATLLRALVSKGSWCIPVCPPPREVQLDPRKWLLPIRGQ